MLDMKWRYVHLLFFFSFIGSWMAFAIIWKVAISQNINSLIKLCVLTAGISSFIITETLKKIIYLTTRREQVRISVRPTPYHLYYYTASDRLDSLCLADK